MLLNILLFFILLNYTYSYNPSCNSCKWFIPDKKYDNDYGLCSFYKNSYPLLGSNITIYEYAIHCRDNESMCGHKGYMHEYIDAISISDLSKKYKELVNQCCMEINDKNNLEQLEREMFEIMEKIKKHHTKNI